MKKTFKKTLFFSVIVVVVATLISCGNKPDNYDRVLTDSEKSYLENLSALPSSDGLQSLKQNCYSCHNPNSESHETMLAPPLVGIKYNYKSAYGSKSLFVRQMAPYARDNPFLI